MQIAIVGAGIVGTATALELARDGHSVTVFEQRSVAAEESSFAIPGLLAPSLLIPWTVPGMGGPLYRQMLGAHATLRLAGGGRAALAWLWRWRKAARSVAAPARLAALARLGQYSLERTRQIAADMELDPESSRGTLVLLRTEQEADSLMQPALQVLRDAGVTVNLVDADTARLIEPGLSAEVPLAGALHAPDGESGNCRLFAQMLRHAAQEMGAHFQFQSRVQAITHSPVGLRLADASAGELRRFDAVVVCAGMASAGLLQPLGVPLPVRAMHGYSISAPLRDEYHAPQGAVIDPLHRVTITRQGQRIRVSGGAELGRHGASHHEPTLQRLYHTLSGWFPGGTQLSSSQVQIWRGARPTLPDGAPVLGASGVPGVWLNAGHGAAGWAQACGSARVLADLLAQRAPALDVQALALRRP